MNIEKSELSQPLNAKQLLTKAQQEVSDAIKEWIETKPVSLDELIVYLLEIRQSGIQQASRGVRNQNQKLISYDEALLKPLNAVYPLNLTRYDNQFQSLKFALHREYEVEQGEEALETQLELEQNKIITQPQNWKEPFEVEMIDQEILPPDSGLAPQIGSGAGRENNEIQWYDKLLLFTSLATKQGWKIVGIPKVGFKGNRPYPYYAIHIATPHKWTIYINNGHGQATYCVPGYLDISDLITIHKSNLQAAEVPRIKFYGYQDPVGRSSESIMQRGKNLVEYVNSNGGGSEVIDQNIKKEKIKKVRPDRKSFTTINRWFDYFEKQGWKGLSTEGMKSVNGGHTFYCRFNERNKTQLTDQQDVNKEKLFTPTGNSDYLVLDTVKKRKDRMDKEGFTGINSRGKRGGSVVEGGKDFYRAFTRRNSKYNKEIKKKNKNFLFPEIDDREDRIDLKSIDDRNKELIKNGWQGLSTAGNIDGKVIEGGEEFYNAFMRWNKKQPKDQQKKNQNIIFPPMLGDRKFDTINDYKKCMIEKGWCGFSTNKLQNKTKGGIGFYRSFLDWNKKQPLEEQESNREVLFGKKI